MSTEVTVQIGLLFTIGLITNSQHLWAGEETKCFQLYNLTLGTDPRTRCNKITSGEDQLQEKLALRRAHCWPPWSLSCMDRRCARWEREDLRFCAWQQHSFGAGLSFSVWQAMTTI